MSITLGPRSQAFICSDCTQFFVWHPGVSGLDKPSGCGACDSPNINKACPIHQVVLDFKSDGCPCCFADQVAAESAEN